jgi:hypothetical protein
MPKPTIASQAKKHGITIDQIKAIAAHGVNVRNDAELLSYMATMNHRIKPGTEMEGGESCTAQSLEQIEEAIRKATNINTVKILKEKVMALKGIVSVQQETRELVPTSEVREEIVRCVSAARAEILKITSDLPPRLSGLSETAIQKILVEEMRNLLSNLSSEVGCLFCVDSA